MNSAEFLSAVSTALGVGASILSVADVACLPSVRMRRELAAGVKVVVTVKANGINMHTVSRLQASVPDLPVDMSAFSVGSVGFLTVQSRISAVSSNCYPSCLTCSDVGVNQCYTCVSGTQLQAQAGSTTGSCVPANTPGVKPDGSVIGKPGVIAVSVVGGLLVLGVLFAIYRCQRGSSYHQYDGSDARRRGTGRGDHVGDVAEVAHLDVSGLALSPDSPYASSPEVDRRSIEMTSLSESRAAVPASGRRGSKPLTFTIGTANDDVMANPFEDATTDQEDSNLWTTSRPQSGGSPKRKSTSTPGPVSRPQNPGVSRKPAVNRA
jgi:hypothetical protein